MLYSSNVNDTGVSTSTSTLPALSALSSDTVLDAAAASDDEDFFVDGTASIGTFLFTGFSERGLVGVLVLLAAAISLLWVA